MRVAGRWLAAAGAVIVQLTLSVLYIQPVAANTLKISPVRTDLLITPGESRTVKVTISNPSPAAVVVRPVQNDFIAGDERGTPALILDETTQAPKHSLKHFMRPMGLITVPPKSSVAAEVVLEVPRSAEPGGYFGALRFVPASPTDSAQVNLNANLASIILLRVSGEVPEKLTLTDAVVQRGGMAGTVFGGGEDITLAVRVYNDSGVQLGPIGRVSVTKGSAIIYETNFNNRNRPDVILPDSARRWEVPLDQIEDFGRYTVTMLLTYGTKNQSIEVTKVFWILPMWSIILGAALLIVLCVGIAVMVYFLRKRRRARRSHARTGLRVR